MSYTSNKKNINKLLLSINSNTKKEVTYTTISSYSPKLRKMTNRYSITIWTKKKKLDEVTGKRKIINYPSVYKFSRQVDVLTFLADLVK